MIWLSELLKRDPFADKVESIFICGACFTSTTTFLALGTAKVGHYNGVPPSASYNQVYFDAHRAHTLVVFDVDKTLIEPVDKHIHVMYLANKGWSTAHQFKEYVAQTYPTVDWRKIVRILLVQAQCILIESSIIR